MVFIIHHLLMYHCDTSSTWFFFCPKNLIPEFVRLFFLDVFWQSSNLTFLFLYVTSGLYLVANPLYFIDHNLGNYFVEAAIKILKSII